MKRLIVIFAGMLAPAVLSGSAFAAEWVSVSKGLNDLDIRSLAVHARDAAVIFAGSERRVYKTENGGNSWKQILSVRGGGNAIRFIYTDPLNQDTVYVATESGVQRSTDSGKRWAQIFKGIGKKAKAALCVSADAQNPDHLWIGTEEGLFRVNVRANHVEKAQGLPGAAVHSILPNHEALYIATAGGIYRRKYGTENWERVFAEPDTVRDRQEKEAEETSLEQFDIEEFSASSFFSNLVYLENQSKFYAATEKGILEGAADGSSWNLLGGQNLPARKINFIAKSSRTFYAATDSGIFQWDAQSRHFREIYKGLESKEVHSLYYSASGDFLLAGTKRGLFKLAYPELGLVQIENPVAIQLKPRDILDQFTGEPSIAEIQNAAVRYAEAYPAKIEEWRRAAARKALLPKVSFDYDLNRDQTIDLDRGGTNDPDVYITGPEGTNRGWSVGVSWDLSELIWNGDQTSIDTRSRLMVELRDDVLTQVTHLYYERRRLQVEMALAPMRDLPVQIEKEIRLEELTAGIDALTGGYLSKRLSVPGGTSISR
ncbi:MAG: WD40/YVTN/BNR-like repeat-containing protein [Candidatus Omnitrophota bacterium]